MLCFFCLIVILVFALNAMINAGMHRIRTSEFGVWNKILQGQINADIVISHRPWDYHPDHRYVGVLVQDAAFMVTVPHFCPDTPPLKAK